MHWSLVFGGQSPVAEDGDDGCSGVRVFGAQALGMSQWAPPGFWQIRAETMLLSTYNVCIELCSFCERSRERVK